MKPRNFLILTTIALFMAVTSVTFSYASSAPKYITIQLTNNDYDDGTPQINCNGDVVWSGYDGHDYEIFLYERSSGTTIPLANDVYLIGTQINCNGDVVWHGAGGIFLYERSTGDVIPLGGAYSVMLPDINDNGDVVWGGFGLPWDDWQFIDIYEKSTGEVIRLRGHSSGEPQISDNYVVWMEVRPWPEDHTFDIFLYKISTRTTTYVASFPAAYRSLSINDKGELVWVGWDGNDQEIFLYESATGTIFQLTNNNSWDRGARINEYGDVAWMEWDGNDSEIFLALRITEITIDIKPGSYPNSINLNSKGVVPVAVLTTTNFDASNVDPSTVKFAGASPVRWTMEDVNGDGRLDMLFHFKTQDLVDLNENSTEATLSGHTIDKRPIEGTDSMNIVPKTKGKDK